ncbi:hypothetical protein D9756_006828 [Leucocoprinus leucothites]|uniref:RING-type domain-containing protein n=1 Tax=Leucocoprinus leucothites TaxID=201217 RepID=A0A8H5G1X9_9AGAR|nr:hypothetical protein D9756_006828 [Leucoagaricus leucothites]
MHDADIIELSSGASSPPPVPIRTPKRGMARNKGKGKMKEVDVIELTDDSDDSDFEVEILRSPPPKRGPRVTRTGFPGSSQRKLKGKQPLVVDDVSDDDIVAAPEPRFLAGPSRVNGDLRPRELKEQLSLNEENVLVASTSSVSGRKDQPRAYSLEESDIGAEVTQVTDMSWTVDRAGTHDFDAPDLAPGGSNMTNGAKNMDVDPQLPPQSPSPTVSSTRAASGPSTVPIPSPSNTTSAPANNAVSLNTIPPPVPVPPPPLLESPEEMASRYVAQVLEIVPDVDPEHCASLVEDHKHLGEGAVERILHILLEDPGYPRIKKGNGLDKGKRKADGPGEDRERPNKKQKGSLKGKAADEDDGLWLNVERPFIGGIDYHDLALNTLQQDYPFIPKPYLRDRLSSHKGFYAPTFFFLRKLNHQLQNGEVARDDCPYQPRKTAYRLPRGGKQRAMVDGEFERELAWVKKTVDIEEGRAIADQNSGGGDHDEKDSDTESEEANEAESDGEDEANGIECGCCFSKYRFEKMIQCPDAHLFCLSCLRSYASTLLGSHNPNITCMSQAVCTATFPASQLVRVLPRKTYALYERLVQAKEIDAAGLEGLEECPFCEWKCVMEVGFEGEKLFRCENDIGGCGVVSCRKCKKLDHLPKSCEEVEQDKKLDARHLVEEAMTKALMRNCPKCQKAFIKESGCNKMTCPNCHALSCYVCRQIITGYEHFNQSRNPSAASSSSKPKKCVLWDKDLDAFHANEVKLAADQAMAEARMLHPEVSSSDLKVDLPSTTKAKNLQGLPLPGLVPLMNMNAMGPGGIRRVANLRRGRRSPPPIVQRRAARRNDGHDGVAREVRFLPVVRPPPPQMPHVHVHVHQHQHEQRRPAQPQPPQQNIPQLRHRPHPVLQHPPQQPQQPPLPGQGVEGPAAQRRYHEVVAQAMMGQYHPHGAPQHIPQQPQRPPLPGQGVEGPAAQRQYHEAIAEAMMGQCRPIDRGVEVGGRILRARPGRPGDAGDNRPPQAMGMGMANNGAGVPAPNALDRLRELNEQQVKQLLQERLQRHQEQQEQLRQQQILLRQRQLEQQRQQQEVQRRLLVEQHRVREQQRQRERQRAWEAHELGLALPQEWLVPPALGVRQVLDRVEIGGRGPPDPDPEYQAQAVGQKRKRGHDD